MMVTCKDCGQEHICCKGPKMSRATVEDQLQFLICCVKHSNNGKVDFAEVASEFRIVSKGAAAKRYERLLKANGSNQIGGAPEKASNSSAPAWKSKAATAKAAAAKRRKIEGSRRNSSDDDEDDHKPVIPKPEPLAGEGRVKLEASGYGAYPYPSQDMSLAPAFPGRRISQTASESSPSMASPYQMQSAFDTRPSTSMPPPSMLQYQSSLQQPYHTQQPHNMYHGGYFQPTYQPQHSPRPQQNLNMQTDFQMPQQIRSPASNHVLSAQSPQSQQVLPHQENRVSSPSNAGNYTFIFDEYCNSEMFSAQVAAREDAATIQQEHLKRSPTLATAMPRTIPMPPQEVAFIEPQLTTKEAETTGGRGEDKIIFIAD